VSGYAALISGSSRGIGKGIALALAADGFSIGVNAPFADADVDETVAELRSLGIASEPVIGDVSDLSKHEHMLDQAEGAFGPLTTLVNNAGVSSLRRGDLLEVTPESYDRCQSVNTRGAFFLTQAWARRVLTRERSSDLHHCVITVSSSNASAVSIARGDYCVSKAGASMMSRLFAVRLGADEIGSYEIQPGVIETAMTAPVKDIYLRRIAEGLTVAQRMGSPSDIGSIALALATGKLAFCTGQALQADGGLVIPRF
jgi:3-oxoacyl-[acyl-carrier protein] reductase